MSLSCASSFFSSFSSAGPKLQAGDRGGPRRTSATKNLRRYTRKCMPKRMPDRMSEFMPKKCQHTYIYTCIYIYIIYSYIYIYYIFLFMHIYAPNSSRWYVRTYVRIVCKGRGRPKKVRSVSVVRFSMTPAVKPKCQKDNMLQTDVLSRHKPGSCALKKTAPCPCSCPEYARSLNCQDLTHVNISQCLSACYTFCVQSTCWQPFFALPTFCPHSSQQ